MTKLSPLRFVLLSLFVLLLNIDYSTAQEKHYRYKYKGTQYLMEDNKYGEMKDESYNSRFSSYIVLSTSADRKTVWLDSDKEEMGFFDGEYYSNNWYKYTDYGSRPIIDVSEETEWTNMLISVNYETVVFVYYVPASNDMLHARKDVYEYVGTTSAPHNVEREKHERRVEEQKKLDAWYEANREKIEAEEAKRQAEEAKRQAEREMNAVRIGKPLPASNYLVDSDGKKVDNSFFKRGSKTLVITYYYSCPPARALMNYIKDKGIDSNVITINVYPVGGKKIIVGATNLFKEKTQEHHNEWYLLQNVPYCVLLDGNGVVISDKLGFFVDDTAEIDSMVSAIRNEQMQAFNLSNIPKNEIWYITTDGNKIAHNFDGCVSHSYTNGKGVIKFKNNLTSIEYRGFYKCSSLKSIRIPDGVTLIGYDAFNGCTSLTSITIPDSVTSIGGQAFSGCSSLTSITIPDGVTSIGYSTFKGCTSLTSITIPDSVTSIGVNAFLGCKSLTSITIPDSVTSINFYSFADCTSLTSVTIGNSVTSIGDGTFKGCTSLKSVTIPDSVTEIEGYAFQDCTSLTSVTIPDSVTSIGEFAFENCKSLTSVTIPDSVTSIGASAFNECSLLTSVTIGNGVTSIGGWAFGRCPSLTSVNIPNSVTSIGEYAFYYCKSLTSVTIPDSVTSIGASAFRECSSLTSITIPDKVTSIGEFAFNKCTSLTSITIPDSVTSIGNRAFQYCDSLTSVTIGNNVTSIRYRTFDGCSSLTSITIPNSVTSIGNYAFRDCSSLTSITIPDSVTSIGEFAFFICRSLTSITIPDSVTEIGKDAITSCTKLKSVIFESPTPPQLGAGVFQLCDPKCVIYVPAANMKAYKKSWKDILGKYPKLKKYKK